LDVRIVGVHEDKSLLDRAIQYFSEKWGTDRRIYADSISNSFGAYSSLPRWYLMLQEDEIVGCCGLINNDFISRQDLSPWLCALYVEEQHRGRKLGKVLLEHVRREAGNLGFKRIYLSTDHEGYYEQYGWTHIAYGYHPWGEESRIYEHFTFTTECPLQFLGNPVLETKRLRMRPFTKADAQDVFAYASSAEVARYMTWEAHQTLEDTFWFIDWAQEQVDRDQLGQWAIEYKETGKVIGSIGFSQFDAAHSCGTVGYALGVDYWNQGLTTEALCRLLQFVFLDMELNRVEAVHFIENTASGRVMEKVGMQYEGTFREKILSKDRYWDVKQYAILRRDWLTRQPAAV